MQRGPHHLVLQADGPEHAPVATAGCNGAVVRQEIGLSTFRVQPGPPEQAHHPVNIAQQAQSLQAAAQCSAQGSDHDRLLEPDSKKPAEVTLGSLELGLGCSLPANPSWPGQGSGRGVKMPLAGCTSV